MRFDSSRTQELPEQSSSVGSIHCWLWSVKQDSKIRRIRSFKHEEPYRLGTEFGGEYVAYGREQQHVELLAQAEEVAEGEDDHLFGVSVQPLSYLHQHGLPGKHKVGFSLPLRQDSIV